MPLARSGRCGGVDEAPVWVNLRPMVAVGRGGVSSRRHVCRVFCGPDACVDRGDRHVPKRAPRYQNKHEIQHQQAAEGRRVVTAASPHRFPFVRRRFPALAPCVRGRSRSSHKNAHTPTSAWPLRSRFGCFDTGLLRRRPACEPGRGRRDLAARERAGGGARQGGGGESDGEAAEAQESVRKTCT